MENPKEEPKRDLKCYPLTPKECYKQETLEEVAERLYPNYQQEIFIEGAKWQQEQYSTEEKHIGHTINEFDKTYIKGFNDGSEWQQERSYSEEEVLNIVEEVRWRTIGDPIEFTKNFKEWFEQFKKK